jgi:hypothetical protein
MSLLGMNKGIGGHSVRAEGVVMEITTSFIVSVLAGITVALLGKPAWLFLSGIAKAVLSDLPSVNGCWTAEFSEPDDAAGETKCSATEEIQLKQLGKIVWGESHVADARGCTFKFKGNIFKNTLLGSYRIKQHKATTGSGTFQLKIAGDERHMKGWCIWYDADTDNVEASPYSWQKD